MAIPRNGAGLRRPQGRSGPVVIAGGGVAGLEAMLAIRRHAEWLEVELIAPARDFVYRPLAVAEPFGLGAALRFDLGALAEGAGVRLRSDRLAGVDAERRVAFTGGGDAVPYGALVLASGARMREALPGALTFWGGGDPGPIRGLLSELESGTVGGVAFCVPARDGWPLPAYELALITASRLAGRRPPRLTLVTPESSPLELFGARASAAARELLGARGIDLRCDSYPVELTATGLRLVPGGELATDRVVAMPSLEGPRIDGVPHDRDGFVPVDRLGRVRGHEEDDLYAAGDLTDFPVKQGGLAAQQADAAASQIAARAGAAVEPAPFRPVLRGLLLTGSEPRFLRAELTGGGGETSAAAQEPLWWPPSKIVGRHLAPFLTGFGATDHLPSPPPKAGALEVEIELPHPDRDGVEVPMERDRSNTLRA